MELKMKDRAYEIMKRNCIPITELRLARMTEVLEIAGQSEVEFQIVKRGGRMRTMKPNEKKIGMYRCGKSIREIWAVWGQATSSQK